MKASNAQLGQRTCRQSAGALAREVDIFDTEIALRKQGKVEERLFAETRLRRGAYGQRYDNGQRYDGRNSRKLPIPPATAKGPSTMWDAPGAAHQDPRWRMNAEQLETMAELAEGIFR